MTRGAWYAAAAYLLWGAFPIYFKAVQEASAPEVLMHRVVWSLAFLALVLAWRRHLGWLRGMWRHPRALLGSAVSAVFLTVNWLLYIWAVHTERVVDASLGYFINPLFSVMLGSLVLRERLRPAQWGAVGLAALGVVWLTWQTHQLPWVALVLAGSFGMYGLLRKTSKLGALEGLSLETLLLFPLALGYLFYLGLAGSSAFVDGSTPTQWLLVAAGPLTAIPLLLFAAGARRIPLTLLGLLQYIAPTLQMLIGVWLYHEPLGGSKLTGFVIIWAALLVYTLEGLWNSRRPLAVDAGGAH
jgi:chloramphenicol-sensitive protein RarD